MASPSFDNLVRLVLESVTEPTPGMLTPADWKSIEEIQQHINNIVLTFSKLAPHLYEMSHRVRIEVLPAQNKYGIGTAAVSIMGNLWFNEQFVRKQSLKQLRGLIIHELLHIMTLTFFRCEDRDPKLWNVATDYYINWMIKTNDKAFAELPDGGLEPDDDGFIRSINGKPVDPPINVSNKDAEGLYDIIFKLAPEIKQQMIDTQEKFGDYHVYPKKGKPSSGPKGPVKKGRAIVGKKVFHRPSGKYGVITADDSTDGSTVTITLLESNKQLTLEMVYESSVKRTPPDWDSLKPAGELTDVKISDLEIFGDEQDGGSGGDDGGESVQDDRIPPPPSDDNEGDDKNEDDSKDGPEKVTGRAVARDTTQPQSTNSKPQKPSPGSIQPPKESEAGEVSKTSSQAKQPSVGPVQPTKEAVFDDLENMSEEELEAAKKIWEQKIIDTISQARSSNQRGGAGRNSGSMVADIFLSKLKPKINWKQLLREFVKRPVGSVYNWKKPHRRSFSTHVYQPRVVKNEEIDVFIIAIDSSGSVMGDRTYNLFINEIISLFDQLKHAKAVILFWHTNIAHAPFFLTPQNAKKLWGLTPSTGGNDIECVKRYLESTDLKVQPKGIIYFTDGGETNMTPNFIRSYKGHKLKELAILTPGGDPTVFDNGKIRHITIPNSWGSSS